MTGGARPPLARVAAFLAAAERWAAPLTAAVLALLVILPGLGTFGLWDPQEMSIADLGRDLAKSGDLAQLSVQRPPLSIWLIAKSFKLVGVSEWGARLPFALGALLVLAFTYGIAARLARPRVGLYACLILLGSPLFVFQARQVTSDLPMVAGATIAVFGLIGLAWPRAGRPAGWLVLDGLLAAGGLAVAYYGGAALLGVVPPLVGAALGTIALGVATRQAERAGVDETVDESSAELPPRRLLGLGLALGALSVALIVAVVVAIYDWMPAQPGQTTLSGKTLAPIKGFVKLIGGAWRPPPAPKDATFDAIINQVVFGFFPWSALVPVALLAGLSRARRDRRGLALLVALGWALAAYVAAAMLERKVGDVRYPGLPALALAAGLMLDELFSRGPAAARSAEPHGPPPRATSSGPFRPLAALFVFCAAVQIGRDAASFPDELPSVNLLGTVKMPPDLGLVRVLPVIGVFFGLSLAAAFAPPGARAFSAEGEPSWRRALEAARRAWARFASLGGAIALGIATAFGLWLAWTFTPALSEHFSYKNVFATYLAERQEGQVLGVMGIPGNGPEYYARGGFERLDKDGRGRQALLGFLKRPERVFAVAPAAELCAIQQASGTEGFPYHVLDDENSRFLLLSNQLSPGKTDQNPLLQALRRAPPEHVKKQISAVFDGQIELLGIDLPESVSHGSLFEVTLYFKVLKKPTQAWKVLGHFDGKSPPRIIGDHDPIDGRCATTYWQPGDYVIDRFEVTAGDLSHARGTYTLRVGFFKKVGAKFENMPVTAGNATPDHRVEVGTIKVK